MAKKLKPTCHLNQANIQTQVFGIKFQKKPKLLVTPFIPVLITPAYSSI